MTQGPQLSTEDSSGEVPDQPRGNRPKGLPEAAPPPRPEEVARYQGARGADYAASAAMVKDILDADATTNSAKTAPAGSRPKASDAEGGNPHHRRGPCLPTLPWRRISTPRRAQRRRSGVLNSGPPPSDPEITPSVRPACCPVPASQLSELTSGSRFQTPELPPVFSHSISSPMLIVLSVVLHMS
jgi:hypothetical protein